MPSKSILFLGAAAITACTSHAVAQTYFGLDYNQVDVAGAQQEGLDAAVGYRVGRFLGVEGGYEGTVAGSPSLNGGYLEATGYLPFGHTGLEAFVDGGGLVENGNIPSINGSAANWAGGFRLDGGLEYQFSGIWAIRASYRYEAALLHSTEETLGLTFSF